MFLIHSIEDFKNVFHLYGDDELGFVAYDSLFTMHIYNFSINKKNLLF